MQSRKVYLACPYSHEDPAIRQARFEQVNKYAGEMMLEGLLIFSPISHTHPIAVQCELPKGFDFWEKFDHAWIEWCDELWVLKLPGWETSVGVNAEIKIAKKLGKGLKFLEIVK
jgi:hypothetical protein